MAVPKFDPKELVVVREEPGMFGFLPPTPVYSYPCTMKEAVHALYKGEPYWAIFSGDGKSASPSVNPDNIARGFCFEHDRIEPIIGRGVPDMFGIEWEYIEQVQGAMVRPGTPFASDAEDLLKKVVWPEPEKWDWAASAAKNNGTHFVEDNYNSIMFLNGWFERLISMFDFENALMVLYDDDQKDAVHEFFDKLTNMYIKIFGLMIDTYTGIDHFSIHDDWGGQKDTFFSPDLVAEMIVPYMKRVTDYLHSRGKNAELHSCGNIMKQVPNMIDAGWDAWMPQNVVDSYAVWEKYGDKILVSLSPRIPEGVGDDDAKKLAREFVDTYMLPGKNCLIGFSMTGIPRAFRDEMYEYSRKKFSGAL